MRAASTRVLEKFADWFASKGGVYQTTVVVVVWWLYEAVRGNANDITMLTVLTVYSAVTQPVLAFCSRKAAEKTDKDLASIKAEEDAILEEVKHD